MRVSRAEKVLGVPIAQAECEAAMTRPWLCFLE